MWGKGNLRHCWWKCKLVQPLWRTVWRFLRKLKIGLPYDPAISLLCIYPKGEKNSKQKLIWKDPCTPTFTAALCTMAKTRTQPKCPSADEGIKEMWCICTMEYYSIIKRIQLNIYSNVDGCGGYYAKWNKSGRKRWILNDIPYVWNLKSTTN